MIKPQETRPKTNDSPTLGAGSEARDGLTWKSCPFRIIVGRHSPTSPVADQPFSQTRDNSAPDEIRPLQAATLRWFRRARHPFAPPPAAIYLLLCALLLVVRIGIQTFDRSNDGVFDPIFGGLIKEMSDPRLGLHSDIRDKNSA
jgi:hypothetical protein